MRIDNPWRHEFPTRVHYRDPGRRGYIFTNGRDLPVFHVNAAVLDVPVRHRHHDGVFYKDVLRLSWRGLLLRKQGSAEQHAHENQPSQETYRDTINFHGTSAGTDVQVNAGL